MAVHTVKPLSGSDPAAADIVRKAMATPEELENAVDTFKISVTPQGSSSYAPCTAAKKWWESCARALGHVPSAISHQFAAAQSHFGRSKGAGADKTSCTHRRPPRHCHFGTGA